MDFEKLLSFGTNYLSNYLSGFFATILKPSLMFQPVAVANDDNVTTPVIPGIRLNPQLLGFIMISIFLGSTINSLIPGSNTSIDLKTTAIIVIAWWTLYSCIIHIICKILGGTGTLIQTLSVSLQLFSVFYVIGNFFTLVWAIIVTIPQMSEFRWPLGVFGRTLIEEPMSVYFIIQFIFITTYLPIVIKHVHNFGKGRQLITGVLSLSIGVISIIFIIFNILSYSSIQVHFAPPH